MRSLRELFSQTGRVVRVEAPAQTIPPPLTVAEKRELQRATVRIERKWRVMDALLADYQSQDRFLRRR